MAKRKHYARTVGEELQDARARHARKGLCECIGLLVAIGLLALLLCHLLG